MDRKIFLFSFLCLIATSTVAQRNVRSQSLYWLRYQLQINFTQKLYFSSEVDNRRFLNPDVQNQLIVHSRLHFKKNKWNFAGGLTFSNAYAFRPELGYKTVTSELRPVGEVSYEFSKRKINFMNRLRIDNRFFEVNENESIWSKSHYVTRLRYRLQLKIPLRKQEEKNHVNLRIANETMVNTEENFFDQTRLYVTMDFYSNRKLSLETGYLYIYQQRFATDDFFSRHVFRFSVLHQLSFDKH